MSGDLLFPFPEPDFIFIHEVFIFGPDNLVKELDERGKQTVKRPEPGTDTFPAPTRGYLTSFDPQQDTSGYMVREGVEAVLLVPNSVNIDLEYVVECTDPALPPHAAGVYDVFSTRPNISHTRVMLRRYRKVWGRWGGGA